MRDDTASETGRRWSALALFTCAIVAAYVVSVFHEARVRFFWDLKSSDVMAVVIGGAALILTAVGIFVAILALWGWRTIKRDAIAAARKEAKACVDAYLESEKVRRAIDQSVLNFLQREQGALVAYLSELKQRDADMTAFDVEIDDAWGNQGSGQNG